MVDALKTNVTILHFYFRRNYIGYKNINLIDSYLSRNRELKHSLLEQAYPFEEFVQACVVGHRNSVDVTDAAASIGFIPCLPPELQVYIFSFVVGMRILEEHKVNMPEKVTDKIASFLVHKGQRLFDIKKDALKKREALEEKKSRELTDSQDQSVESNESGNSGPMLCGG